MEPRAYKAIALIDGTESKYPGNKKRNHKWV